MYHAEHVYGGDVAPLAKSETLYRRDKTTGRMASLADITQRIKTIRVRVISPHNSGHLT